MDRGFRSWFLRRLNGSLSEIDTRMSLEYNFDIQTQYRRMVYNFSELTNRTLEYMLWMLTTFSLLFVISVFVLSCYLFYHLIHVGVLGVLHYGSICTNKTVVRQCMHQMNLKLLMTTSDSLCVSTLMRVSSSWRS